MSLYDLIFHLRGETMNPTHSYGKFYAQIYNSV
jgi:hypothetical protein